jgi:hypothetical protein
MVAEGKEFLLRHEIAMGGIHAISGGKQLQPSRFVAVHSPEGISE